MSEVVPLAEALDESRFGAKATGLGAAARAGLPFPPGIALSGTFVDAVAAGHDLATELLVTAAASLATPLAVRSSASLIGFCVNITPATSGASSDWTTTPMLGRAKRPTRWR